MWSIVSKSLPNVSIVIVPLAGARTYHHTVAPAGLNCCSLASVVAPTFLPVVEPGGDESPIALTQLSLAGADEVTVIFWRLNPKLLLNGKLDCPAPPSSRMYAPR